MKTEFYATPLAFQECLVELLELGLLSKIDCGFLLDSLQSLT